MSHARIAIADTNETFVRKISAYINSHRDYEVTALCRSGAELIEIVNKEPLDIIIMDLILEDMDGISVLKKLRKRSNLIPVIVCSGFYNETSVRSACRNGAAGFLCKPVNADILLENVYEIQNSFEVSNCVDEDIYDSESDSIIAEKLDFMGIHNCSRGYMLIKQAVKSFLSDNTIMDSMTKQLYPELARIFDSTPERVERNIRSAIDSAHERGRLATGRRKPTNREMIFMLAEQVKAMR